MTLLNTLDYRHAAQKEIEMNKIVLPIFGQVSQAYQIIIPLKGSQPYKFQSFIRNPNTIHLSTYQSPNLVQEFMRETKGVMLKVDREPDVSPTPMLLRKVLIIHMVLIFFPFLD